MLTASLERVAECVEQVADLPVRAAGIDEHEEAVELFDNWEVCFLVGTSGALPVEDNVLGRGLRSVANFRESFFRSVRLRSSSSESGSHPDVSADASGVLGLEVVKLDVKSGDGIRFETENVGESAAT